MFNPKTIRESFSSLIGFRQNIDPDLPQLPTSLVYDGSDDKLLIDHPLCTVENIDATARNYGKYIFPAWSNVTVYAIGDRVTFSQVNYEATDTNVGEQPDTLTDWKVLTPLDLFMTDIVNSAAEELANRVVTEKKLNKQTKTVLQSARTFNGAGNFTDSVVNEGNLVGVEIRLRHRNNIVAIIERVGLQLTMAQSGDDALPLYLYHSSQEEPVQVFNINQTKANSFEWHTLKARLNYLTDDLAPGGVFYLMYDQDDLLGQAIKKNYNFDTGPCYTCTPAEDMATFQAYNGYFAMRAVKVTPANRNATDSTWLWDITKTKHTPDNNYGMNFELTVRCDLTAFFIQQKDVFAFGMRMLTAQKLLEAMATTTRQNNAQTKVDVLARNELMSTTSGGMGFMKRVDDAIKAIGFEVADLDATCMPCAKTAGVKYRVAGM